MNQVVARTTKELHHFQPISPMGIWAAEAIHQQSSIYAGHKMDITCFGHNGLRIKSLPQGNITRGKLFELMPFDNNLAILEVDSVLLQQFLNLAAFKGGWPVAGASFEIKDKKAQNILIRGEPLRSGKIYKLATSDYVATGGENAFFLKTAQRVILPKLMRDAFIEAALAAMEQGKFLDAQTDDRIKIVQK
jgi:2',3'-cyclic-nucleotide 2'-phosphodiesterase (5'-nucleotidase family)